MIRLFFLKTICTIFLSSTFLVASQHDQTDDATVASTFQTPLRPVAITEVEPTPGQFASNLQAQFFKKENFIAVLGLELVDSWEMDWEQLENPTISFTDPIRASAMSQLHVRLANLARKRTDESFLALRSRFLLIRDQIMVVHADRLDILALAYFHRIFPNASLTPKTKLGGVQLGERIIVEWAGQPVLTYHAKTHSAGRLSSNSTAAKLVNPQELMAYRVLQYLGIGCESHFFQRSPEDVYIATLDAGTGGTFCLFEVMSGHLGHDGNDVVGRQLSGCLIDINQSPSQINPHSIEAVVAGDHAAQNFIHQMARLDIITRICRLHDLLNNPANFGFFEADRQTPTIRVIDFRVIDDPLLRQENYDPFGGFLVGNGLYNYAGSHKTMRYVLHDRPRQARVETARRIMGSGLAGSIQEAVQQAYLDVSQYLSQEVFVLHHRELMPQLNEYHDAIVCNADVFLLKLQEWTPEADAAREAEHEKYRRGSTGSLNSKVTTSPK